MVTNDKSSSSIRKSEYFRRFIRNNNLQNDSESDKKRHLRLKKELMDYILLGMKEQEIRHINKKTLNRIEDKIEFMIDKALDKSFEEIKKDELDSFLEDDEIFFDRYEMPEKDDEIIILDDDFLENIRFDTYDISNNR